MALPDYEAWALFASVADLGSFRSAATANRISVATVSKAIARLEARLGIALFHRTSRRVTLTLAGEGLVDRARMLVASGAAVEEAARDDATTLSGPIRLTAPLSLGQACLGAILADFSAQHPDVTIDLVLSDARVDLVAEGMDFGLRIAVQQDSSLLIQGVKTIRAGMVASPAYIAQFGMPAHASDLRDHRVIGYGHERRDGPFPLIGPDQEKIMVQPHGPLMVNNGEMMLAYLRAGMATALLPRFIVARDLDEGTLLEVLPGWHPPQSQLAVVSPHSRFRPARVRALTKHLIDHLRQLPILG